MLMLKLQHLFVDKSKKLVLKSVQAGAHGALWKHNDSFAENQNKNRAPGGRATAKIKTPLKLFSGGFFSYRFNKIWWSTGESNSSPQQCECCALPDELVPLTCTILSETIMPRKCSNAHAKILS